MTKPDVGARAEKRVLRVLLFSASLRADSLNTRLATLARSVAEGDLVAVHSHFVRQPGERGIAVMDIFRVEQGKVVEHWDVLQEATALARSAS